MHEQTEKFKKMAMEAGEAEGYGDNPNFKTLIDEKAETIDAWLNSAPEGVSLNGPTEVNVSSKTRSMLDE